MASTVDTPLGTALRAVGMPAELGSRLELGGERGSSAPRLEVEEFGGACVGAALLAAGRLHEARTGEWLAPSLDRGHLRAALVSERLFRAGGEPAGAGFAPQSRFWPAADGWVRTHANYPWHHAALLKALGVADDEALGGAIASRAALEVEDAVFAAGGIAAAVRTAAEWSSDPQGAAVAAEPLVDRVRTGDADPRVRSPRGAGFPRAGAAPSPRGWFSSHTEENQPRKQAGSVPAPAAGVRVLDLTRVIAGPVCSRYLGALGADVLRLDPPDLPDLEPGAAADSLLGKRSASLDLRSEAAARRLDALLDDADVVLLGYRPGALARFGLAPDRLAARHPGLVVMELAAWGHSGPCHARRGFDSIVQAASGIAIVERGPDGRPGALPCQLLDHGTGYLAAAAVLVALADQWETGGSHLRRLSLARTAHWLLGDGDGASVRSERDPGVPMASSGDAAGATPTHDPPPAARPPWSESAAAFVAPVDGDPRFAAVPPPGSLDGTPLRWRGRMGRYASDEPAWRESPRSGRSPRG
ncbi:MAG TPA: CoA transferase [Solirubrobacterales bacterium]